MIIKYRDHVIEVPNDMIKAYMDQFSGLRDPEMRNDLYVLRESIFQLFILAKKNPKILNLDAYRRDFRETLAMREALFQLKLLHDA